MVSMVTCDRCDVISRLQVLVRVELAQGQGQHDGSVGHQKTLILQTSSSHLPPPHGEGSCSAPTADPHTSTGQLLPPFQIYN